VRASRCPAPSCRWRWPPAWARAWRTVGLGRWRGAGVRLSLSVASTVVLLRALEARGVLDTQNGRIAVGWLVVEDLAMVLVLVMLPATRGMAAAGRAAWPRDSCG
jgi:CPA2 family monovalent cation:H+ antiporter-2